MDKEALAPKIHLAIRALCGIAVFVIAILYLKDRIQESRRPSFASSPTPTVIATQSAIPTIPPTPLTSQPPSPTALPKAIEEKTFSTRDGIRYADVAKYQAELSSAGDLASALAVIRSFLGYYGLSTLQQNPPSSLAKASASWENANEDDLETLKAFGAIFFDEWGKYPRAWVAKSGLRTVAMVDKLTVGNAWRFAMPDVQGETLYYSISAGASYEDSDYVRGNIHHEYDHLIEYTYFGGFSHFDPDWTENNPPGFDYGPGGSAWNASGSAYSAHPSDGFVSNYSYSGIEEDKAETYSYLFTSKRNKLLSAWTTNDASLKRKVQLYKSFIRTQVPLMDDGYFDKVNP